MCIYISDDSNGSAVKHSRDSFQRASLSWNCDSRNPRQVLHTNCWGGQFENVVCWKYCSLLVAWSVPQQVTTTSWVDSGDIWTWKLAPVIVTWFLMINSRSLQTHDLIEPQTENALSCELAQASSLQKVRASCPAAAMETTWDNSGLNRLGGRTIAARAGSNVDSVHLQVSLRRWHKNP